ncbi:hypothetical protein D1872_260970 [compost metagenome]
MLPLLLGYQITSCNLKLLQLRIARNAQYLHPVQQWARNIMKCISRRHEHHIRQIERQLYKMIAKRIVLLRVQHLQQSRGRITTEVRSHFVNLIKQKDRIHGTG